MLKFFESHLSASLKYDPIVTNRGFSVFTDKHENRDRAEKAKKMNGK